MNNDPIKIVSRLKAYDFLTQPCKIFTLRRMELQRWFCQGTRQHITTVAMRGDKLAESPKTIHRNPIAPSWGRHYDGVTSLAFQ